MTSDLKWKKYPVLNDGFICLVDAMGDDSSIVQAARVSYGKDERKGQNHPLVLAIKQYFPDAGVIDYISENFEDAILQFGWGSSFREVYHTEPQYDLIYTRARELEVEQKNKDRQLIRYLLNHSHTTPFEMVELKFLVRVPMDCWRQWIRHRTASVNEYSTRYTEAIDSQQTTSPQEWRLQATDNKQGSSGFLEEWPEDVPMNLRNLKALNYSPGEALTKRELDHKVLSRELYESRIALGIAKEQARKDLPLSTYTEAYWKCDLHNIFNFLRLRMDSHAQYEIRCYANAMAEIVKQIVPVAWEAFEDYVLGARKFSRMETECIKNIMKQHQSWGPQLDSMTNREWKEFLEKLS